MKARAWLSGLCVASIGAIVAAQPPAVPSFRFERPIVGDCAGPCRLPVDVPLLAGVTAADLRDLRLYDSKGAEVGYVLVGNPSAEPSYLSSTILPIAPVETRTSKSSGFEADLGETTIVDRFRLDGLPSPFLKRVQLEGSGDREHWTQLVRDGTLFDLPNYDIRQTELRFTAGQYRYLRLTWDDTNSGRLRHPSAALAGRRDSVTPPPALTTPLAFERRPSEPRRSIYRLRLPGGHLPIAALELDVGGGHVMRNASVLEARLTGSELVPVPLGHAALRRVVTDGVTAAALRIPIEHPSDSQLDLVLEDGDNPPLDLRGVTAIFDEQPWIYFEATGGGLAARYGNPTLSRPQYDIEAAKGKIAIDAVPKAGWGEPASRAADDRVVAAAQFPTAGAPVDASLFRYLRDIPAGEAGLIAVAFDAPVLAHSAGPAGRFADVRIVDGAGRQIPYVLERASEPLSLPLAIERLTTRPKGLPEIGRARQSVYRLKLPDDGLPTLRIVLETNARVFDRQVSVAVEHPADARRDPSIGVVASARWLHADADRAAAPLTISVPGPRAAELLLLVDEGDNAPLPIQSVRALLPAYRARLFREVGAAMRLAYGRRDLPRPQYDLALLAQQVLATPAVDVHANAEPAPSAAAEEASFISARVFWIVLGGAAVALLAMIARLLKKA